MSIRIEKNKVLCNKFGNDFLDLLGDLGWDYQRMSKSGRETYDEMMQMIGVIDTVFNRGEVAISKVRK